jgi:hypothetical protein
MNSKLPRLFPVNSIGIEIVGTTIKGSFGISIQLSDIVRWPNRGEIKRIGKERRLYLYNGDLLLLDSIAPDGGGLPDSFGLTFKRVVETSVDFKSKTQYITAIFTTFDILNSVERMHEFRGYDS